MNETSFLRNISAPILLSRSRRGVTRAVSSGRSADVSEAFAKIAYSHATRGKAKKLRNMAVNVIEDSASRHGESSARSKGSEREGNTSCRATGKGKGP